MVELQERKADVTIARFANRRRPVPQMQDERRGISAGMTIRAENAGCGNAAA